jgi:type IV secretion system protein VirB11
LIQEAVVTVPRHLIAEAIDVVIFIEGRGTARRIAAVEAVEGLDPRGDYSLRPLALQELNSPGGQS